MSGYQRTDFERDTEEEDEEKSIPNVIYKNGKNGSNLRPDSFSNGFSNANFLNDGSALLTPGSHDESTWTSDQTNPTDQPLNNPLHPVVGPRLNATTLDEERGLGSNQPRVTFLSRNGIVCFVSSKLNPNKHNNNNERKRRTPSTFSFPFTKLTFFERLTLYVLVIACVIIILLTSLLLHSVSYFHNLLGKSFFQTFLTEQFFHDKTRQNIIRISSEYHQNIRPVEKVLDTKVNILKFCSFFSLFLFSHCLNCQP